MGYMDDRVDRELAPTKLKALNVLSDKVKSDKTYYKGQLKELKAEEKARKKAIKKVDKFIHKRLSYRPNKDARATLKLHSDDYEYKDRSRFFSREFANEKEEADKSFFFS